MNTAEADVEVPGAPKRRFDRLTGSSRGAALARVALMALFFPPAALLAVGEFGGGNHVPGVLLAIAPLGLAWVAAVDLFGLMRGLALRTAVYRARPRAMWLVGVCALEAIGMVVWGLLAPG